MTEFHRALFFGKITRNFYRVDSGRDFRYHSYGYQEHYYKKPEIVTVSELVNWKQFYSCDFEKPPLEIGEKVYINELDLTVLVVDRVRSTNGEYVYYVEHIIEQITDGGTMESKKVAEEELKREMDRYFSITKKEEKTESPKKKWWKL